MIEETDKSPSEISPLPQNIFCELLVRLRLVKPGVAAVVAGALCFIAMTFLPLLVICMSQSTAFPGQVSLPLCLDYSTLTRFLIVGPCLLISDAITKPWLVKVTENFVSQQLIEEEQLAEYNRLVRNVFKLRESLKIELILLILAVVSSYCFSNLILSSTGTLTCWYAKLSAAGQPVLSNAGSWVTFVSQPLFRFVLLSWGFEYLLWVYYYARVARFSLKITPTHPDSVGGLGFINVGQTQFCLSAFALSVAFFGVIGEALGPKQQALVNVGAAWVLVMLLLFLGPLLLFTPGLMRKKREAALDYSNLSHYVCASFARRWLPAKLEDGHSMLESNAASALADLNAIFQIAANMRVLIFGKQSIMVFLVAIGIAALPLVASVIPLDELLKQIAKALT